MGMGARSGRYEFRMVVLFVLVHVGVLAVFFVPFSPRLLLWTAATYAIRMFAVTAGYHRYFSHRSYNLGRSAQFWMAALAQTSGQKGVLWWAAHHRWHHRYSDAEPDVHSPGLRGFWWAHVGWILSNEYDGYDEKQIADFAKFPELRWLDRYHWVPVVTFALLVLLIGGPAAFVWGFVVSTVLLYHVTFCINSLAHVFGSRRFDTPDQSRNNWFLALLTFGEGWHNNHHFSMASCRQGYRWWEVDITYAVLKVLSFLGIARDLRPFRVPGQRARRAA
jgi:stearoyl-CoA desaturase (delta-9 desaturase)